MPRENYKDYFLICIILGLIISAKARYKAKRRIIMRK